jgi:hypothetical protein
MDDVYDPATHVLGYLAELRGMELDEWTDGTIEERGLRLHRVRALAGLLDVIANALEESLSGSMEYDRMRMPYGELIREETKRERWTDEGASDRLRDDLAEAVAVDIAMDVATGEIDPLKRNIAIAAMRAAFVAIPSFSSLKLDGRRRFRLDLRDYRETLTGYKVTVIAAEDS